jgi:hypothetical protein
VPACTEAVGVDVIGARYADLPAAIAARHAILASVAMPAADLAVRPLGTTRYDEPVAAFVLAGRFPSALGSRIVRLMRDHGGTIILRRAEWAPRARPLEPAPMPRPHPGRVLASRARRSVRQRPRRPAARWRVGAAPVVRHGS